MNAKKPLYPQNLTAAAVHQLLLDLFDGSTDGPTDGSVDGAANALLKPVGQWVTTSKPFAAFAQTYLPKIRKKVKTSRDAEEMHNLYCELRTAYLLLQEPKFALAYEPYTKAQGRSADFAVTFRTHTTFHVEVTRLRAQQQEGQQEGPQEDAADAMQFYESRRLTDTVCEKFGQFSPDTPNVLWVWSASRAMAQLDVGQVMLELKQRAEQRDADLFARHGFGKPADVIRHFQRLSAILVLDRHEGGADQTVLWWQNKDARRPLPAQVANRLRSVAAAESD